MISLETKVGLMVIGGLSLVVLGVLVLGNFRVEKGWELKVMFADIADLKIKAPVKIAGVDVGSVKRIELGENKAMVTLQLRKGLQLHEDTRAEMATEGYIGRRYLKITPGSPQLPLLKEGDMIVGTQPVDYGQLLSVALDKFSQSMEVLETLKTNQKMGNNLAGTLQNLQEITARLNHLLAEREDDLNQSFKNLKNISEDFARVSHNLKNIVTEENKKLLESTLKNINAVSEKLDTILEGLEPEPKTIKGKVKRKALFHFLKKKEK